MKTPSLFTVCLVFLSGILLWAAIAPARISQILDVAICKGSGPGWNCNGAVSFALRTNNGTYLGPFVALPVPPPGTASGYTWTTVK